MSQDVSLSCGDTANFQNCEAIAEIKNKKVTNIIVTNKGGGYLPGQPPSVEIVSSDGMGSGAKAECVVDDDGNLLGCINRTAVLRAIDVQLNDGYRQAG